MVAFSLYMYKWKMISVGGVVYFTVMFDHPSCFLTFCRSGIPTSCYIFIFITCCMIMTTLHVFLCATAELV